MCFHAGSIYAVLTLCVCMKQNKVDAVQFFFLPLEWAKFYHKISAHTHDDKLNEYRRKKTFLLTSVASATTTEAIGLFFLIIFSYPAYGSLFLQLPLPHWHLIFRLIHPRKIMKDSIQQIH